MEFRCKQQLVVKLSCISAQGWCTQKLFQLKGIPVPTIRLIKSPRPACEKLKIARVYEISNYSRTIGWINESNETRKKDGTIANHEIQCQESN